MHVDDVVLLTTGHFAMGVLFQASIQNGIRDLVTHLVYKIRKKSQNTQIIKFYVYLGLANNMHVSMQKKYNTHPGWS